MPFTKTEIENALLNRVGVFSHMQTNLEKLKATPNYDAVCNYLTGATNFLPAVARDENLFVWSGLLSLLKTIDPPGSDDQRVLDVIRQPDLVQYLEHDFFAWIIKYGIRHNDDQSWQAIVAHFKLHGKSDADIFDFLMLILGYENAGAVDIDHTAMKNFLVGQIQSWKELHYLQRHLGAWSTVWNLFFFKLLDEVNESFAGEYALYSLRGGNGDSADYLLKYRDGHYIPAMINLISRMEKPFLPELQANFGPTLHLYEADKDRFLPLVLKVSKQYLEIFSDQPHTNRWENGFDLMELDKLGRNQIPYSANAFYFVLQNEPENAFRLLDQWMKEKKVISSIIFEVLVYYKKQEAFPYIRKALETETSDSLQLLKLLAKNFDASAYLPVLWSLTSNKSKPAREQIADILARNDPAAESKAITLLTNKNAASRQTAALILSYQPTDTSVKAILGVLNKETNDNARDLLLSSIIDSLPQQVDKTFTDEMISAAGARGKLKQPLENWLDEKNLKPLYYQDGTTLSPEAIRFLFYRMNRVKTMNSDPEAKFLIQQLDKEKAAPFANELINLFIQHDAKAELKFLMTLAALLGDAAVVDKIAACINRWIEESRHKMAEYGVGALALQGSDKALRRVEWYSRKYKNKKANVGTAASLALENAAGELGITINELGDRIVPDFGFDGLFKHFTADGDEYRAFIDSNFKVAFFNEDNKKLKAIPAGADAVLKDEFKAIAKEVRDITRSQSSRLEYYLVIQRKWTKTQWQRLFLQNPVMFIYATKILWGLYDLEGKLTGTFLCNEDTSLIDLENNELTLEDDALIGIVHPQQLSPEQIQQWRQQFFDLSIEPIFPQLERRVPDLNEMDLSKRIITKYQGRQMVPGSTKSTLERYGWRKGPVGDGGMITSFNLLYSEKRLEAILEVQGIGAGYGWGGDEMLERLYIVDRSKANQRWFYPEGENEERLVKPEQVPPIFLSELLSAIESIKRLEKKKD